MSRPICLLLIHCHDSIASTVIANVEFHFMFSCCLQPCLQTQGVAKITCTFVTRFKCSNVMVDLVGRITWWCVVSERWFEASAAPFRSAAIEEFVFQRLHKF